MPYTMAELDYRSMLIDATNMDMGDPYENSNNASSMSLQFLTRCARNAGIPEVILGNYESVMELVAAANKEKGWHNDTTQYTPKVGDIAIFGEGFSDNIPIQVGLVTAVRSDDKITVTLIDHIGHSRSCFVASRNVMRNSSYILGYVSPPYDKKIQFMDSVTGTVQSRAPQTQAFVLWVKERYNITLKPDAHGILPLKERKKLIPAWQSEIRSIYKISMMVTNRFDRTSVAAGSRHPISDTSDPEKNHTLIFMLQGLLYGWGLDPKALNGIYTPATANAVYAFQRTHCTGEASGKVDGPTWSALFTAQA